MIILYTPDHQEKYDALITWLENQSHPVKNVGPKQLHHKLLTLLTEENLTEHEMPENYLSEPFLYLDLAEEEQNKLLEDMRNEKVYIRYKAKRTKNNENWTLAYLTEHIVEEAREVTMIHKLLAHVKATNELDLSNYPEDRVEKFQTVLAEAQQMLNKFGKEPTKADDIEALINRLVESSMEMIQHEDT